MAGVDQREMQRGAEVQISRERAGLISSMALHTYGLPQSDTDAAIAIQLRAKGGAYAICEVGLHNILA